jgi:hypothetical protein
MWSVRSINARLYLSLVLLVWTSAVSAELKELDDESLEDQKGQAGITIDIEFEMSIGEIAWQFGDGKVSKNRKIQNYHFEEPQRIEYVLPDEK